MAFVDGAAMGGPAAAEQAARLSYGRLIAYLATQSRNIAAAEDALAEAFAKALQHWPVSGVPENPEAWLLTAARNELRHFWRHEAVKARNAAAEAALNQDEAYEVDSTAIPDERLKLLFAAAHPAIDPAIQTPLMLQVVLGLDAARIAAAFLTAPATMSQRLVRAKTKIRDAGIAFQIPDQSDMPQRLGAVLAAIYAAFTSGYEQLCSPLAEEAIWLGRLLATLLPKEPEALGLLALMLHTHARRYARRDFSGAFIPLGEQDPDIWDQSLQTEAEQLLRRAATLSPSGPQLGRYQLEAAIQSVHAERRYSGRTNWSAIAYLYQSLIGLSPTLGARINHAVAVAESGDAGAAIALLSHIPTDAIATYQPFWVAAARIYRLEGRADAMHAAQTQALALTSDPALLQHLKNTYADISIPKSK